MIILPASSNSCDLYPHTLQGCFTGTGAILWLPQCQWSNPERYILNQTIPNHNQEKNMRIIVQNYCTSPISWRCCIRAFMCSSLASVLTRVRMNSMKLLHGNTGKEAVVFRQAGRVATTASRNPLLVGKVWKQGNSEFLFHLQKFFRNWVRVMHICVSKLTIIGSDNGLSPGWRQAIIWTNAEILFL